MSVSRMAARPASSWPRPRSTQEVPYTADYVFWKKTAA